MNFRDILRLALRNLREAKLRAGLTTMGVLIGVAVIVTMVSFGLGLQRNTVERFQKLDLFNEVTVYGRSLNSLLAARLNKPDSERRTPPARRGEREASRVLDDAAIAEIEKIPGVVYVEPNVTFTAYVRANGRVERQTVSGARVPNRASRFANFSAGTMLAPTDAGGVVVDKLFLSTFGFAQATDAVGQEIEFLAPPDVRDAGDPVAPRAKGEAEQSAGASFFGLPLEADESVGDGREPSDEPGAGMVAHRFRIVGVLKDEVEDARGNRARFRGLMPVANIYAPLSFAREWDAGNRDPLDEVALRLARQSGVIKEGEAEGYGSATVRVEDIAAAGEVVRRLNGLGFSSFGLITELDELRTIFLVINSALGLLGGISLLVASFGIANTMIMSIFERTREIGIMKAIGAEDREIKLIFFSEAAVIGLAGGIAGALAAWGIDKLANQLVYKFLLAPKGADFIDFFSLPPYLWLGAILFAMSVSILAALYPASRAARIDPVKALRHD